MIKKAIINKDIYIQNNIELLYGDWLKRLDIEIVKRLIAESLNEWTISQDKKLELNGYLITDLSVFLIVRSERGFHYLLNYFYEIVIKTLKKYENSLILNEEELKIPEILYDKLLIKTDFFDENLIKLLTGKPVTSNFNDLKLAYYKNQIKNNNYCSAIDYSGAFGPVIVSLIATN